MLTDPLNLSWETVISCEALSTKKDSEEDRIVKQKPTINAKRQNKLEFHRLPNTSVEQLHP